MARKPALNKEKQRTLKYIVEQEIEIYGNCRDNQIELEQIYFFSPQRLSTGQELGERIFDGVPSSTINKYIKQLIPKELCERRKSYLNSQARIGKTHSPEARIKMSEAKSGENHPMYGKTHSPEARIKMSEAKSRENNPMYGKTPSPETRRKTSEALSGENNHMYGKTRSPETRRKTSEALSGENNPNWKGGTSFLTYSPLFEKVMKEYIRARDDYNCQFCDIPENGKAHAVHHIDHDKNNNLEQNLITLCGNCHNNETASKEDLREEWIEWCQSEVSKIYEVMGGEKKTELQQLRNSLESKVI